MSEGKNARDEQFMGFAKALMAEILAQGDLLDLNRDEDEAVVAKCEQLLARQAYDLVTSTVWHVFSFGDPDSMSAQEIIDSVPDLPELPKEQV